MERTLEFLNNQINKLTADNEYLDRQIIFLTDRLKTYKQTREENGKTIADLRNCIKVWQLPLIAKPEQEKGEDGAWW
jgi:hypothetical protein